MLSHHYTELCVTFQHVSLLDRTLSELSLMKQLPPLSMRFPLWFCFYTFCIVLEVFRAINLHPWNVSELPPPSVPNSDTGSSSLHPLSVYIPPHLSLSPPTVWTLGWRAPVGQYGDCEGGAQEESSSNLFQGEAGSVGVEVDQAIQPQYGASELSFASGVKLGSCMLSVKPEHLWKELSGMSALSTDSAVLTARLRSLCTV